MDPPFRSRFQARDVRSPFIVQFELVMKNLKGGKTAENSAKALLRAMAILAEMRDGEQGSFSNASLPEYPQSREMFIVNLFNVLPKIPPRTVSDFLFPWPSLLRDVGGEERYFVINKVFKKFNMNDGETEMEALEPFVKDFLNKQQDLITKIEIRDIKQEEKNSLSLFFDVELESVSTSKTIATVKEEKVRLTCSTGTFSQREKDLFSASLSFYLTSSSHKALSEMLLLHSLNFDFCIIGEKGGGKTKLVNHFAHLLGYRIEHVPLYKDVSSRQLLQRRATLDNGDTIWEDSPLVVCLF